MNMNGQPVMGQIADWILANVAAAAHDREVLPIMVAAALEKWEPAEFIRAGISFRIELTPKGEFAGKVVKFREWEMTEGHLTIHDLPDAVALAHSERTDLKLADLIDVGGLEKLPDIAVTSSDGRRFSFEPSTGGPWYEYREKLLKEEPTYSHGWVKKK